MASVTKPYSVVLYSPTGFTGRLCLRYLANHPNPPARWAVAGRSLPKLEKVLREEGIAAGKNERVGLLVADGGDEESLRKMCAESKVVLSTVGPYILYGALLYRICAETGTHYVDLSGESSFVSEQISLLNKTAQSTGAIMIPSSGFDSMPSDLSTFFAVKEAQKLAAASNPSLQSDTIPIGRVRAAFRLVGGISGGTYASIIDAMTRKKQKERDLSAYTGERTKMQKAFGWLLNTVRGKGKSPFGLVNHESGIWGGFWFMSVHNVHVVRRSWEIFQQWKDSGDSDVKTAYGPNFEYNEFLRLPGPISSFLFSLSFFTVVGLFGFGVRFIPPIRWLAKRFGPAAGEGPSPEMMKNGWYKVTAHAHTEDDKYVGKAVFFGKGDPGYNSTSRIISESALALAEEYDSLSASAKRGGILTPATALGDILRQRFKKYEDYVQVTIEAEAWEKGVGKKSKK